MLDPLGPCAESVWFKPMADGKPSALAMVLLLCADSCVKLSGCIICIPWPGPHIIRKQATVSRLALRTQLVCIVHDCLPVLGTQVSAEQ